MACLYLPDGCTQADLDRYYHGSDEPDFPRYAEDDYVDEEWWFDFADWWSAPLDEVRNGR